MAISVPNYPEQLAEWVPVEIIGTGGFSIVYKVCKRDGKDFHYSAVKHIAVDGSQKAVNKLIGDGFIESFADAKGYFDNLREKSKSEINNMYRYATRIACVPIFDDYTYEHNNDYGFDVFIRMQLLNSLEAKISNKSLPVKEVVRLGVSMCDALAGIHSEGQFHRDVKPANILMDDAEPVNYKLSDFGTVQDMNNKTRHSTVGTPVFAAPEVWSSRYDQRVDVYSLGMTLWVCLNRGHAPYTDINKPVTKADYDHSNQMLLGKQGLPDAVDATPALNAVLRKACAYKADERYRNMEEFKRELLQAVAPPAPFRKIADALVKNLEEQNDERRRQRDVSKILRKNRPVKTHYVLARPRLLVVILILMLIACAFIYLGIKQPDTIIRIENWFDNTAEDTFEWINKTVKAIYDALIIPDDSPDDPEAEEPEEEASAAQQTAIVSYLPQQGEIITFGAWEQDNDTSNGSEPIEWLVLDNSGNTLSLLSLYGLTCRRFNEQSSTWETSELRYWLNGDFYKTAFSDAEKASICPVSLTDDVNYWVEDRVFVPNLADLEAFLPSEQRVCYPTATAIAEGAYVSDVTGGCWWWVNTAYSSYTSMYAVKSTGEYGSADVGAVTGCVRVMIILEY